MRAPAIALAASLALAALPGGAGPNDAGAADCVPVQHSKTVVKRVKLKRHGKVVRVKRKRKVRWTTCEPPPPATLAPCAEPASSLGVTARDEMMLPRYTLSRACVTAGVVSVELNNQGEDPHHVFMRPLGSAESDPRTLKLPDAAPFEVAPLTQSEDEFGMTAGDWYLWCDLLDHEGAGMHAQLAVR